MMTRILVVIASLALFFGSALASAAERKFTVHGFDSIRIMGAINIEITTDRGMSASATAENQRILDRISLRKAGDELVVSVKALTDHKDRFSASDLIVLRLTTPALRKITHRGSGSVTVDQLTGRNTHAAVGGFGSMTIGSLESDNIEVIMSGGGSLQMSGEVQEAKLSLLGASNFNGETLTAEKLILNQRGPASSRITVERDAEITNTGSGIIEILGRPNCLVRSAGAAEIICNPKRR